MDQRYNFGEHGRDGMPVGEQARPRGVSKRFRHLHVQRIWMLLDTLGALQKLHQEVSAGTRAEKSAGTLIYSSVSIQYEKFYGWMKDWLITMAKGGERERERKRERKIDSCSCTWHVSIYDLFVKFLEIPGRIFGSVERDRHRERKRERESTHSKMVSVRGKLN